MFLNIAMLKYPELNISGGLSGYVLDSKKIGADGWCPVGKKIVIDTKGDVFPCVLLMDEKFKIGNIKTNRIEDLKSNLTLQNLSCARAERKNKIDKCRICMWKNFCQSSCMGEAHEKKGTIWDTDEFCAFRKNLYEQSVIKLSKEITFKKHRELGEDINTECFNFRIIPNTLCYSQLTLLLTRSPPPFGRCIAYITYPIAICIELL